ncbi:MAG: polyprenyl diphosphate synthase [Mariprofundaceae bacterium]
MDPARTVPGHVASIMDGNGRWARLHHLPRLEGHRRGAVAARNVVQWAADAGVRVLSLFAFSTENWSRPKAEVNGLMHLLSTLLPTQLIKMNRQGVKLRTLGDISALPSSARSVLEEAREETRNNTRIELVLCLNYGGQQEVVAGARALARWALSQDDPEKALADADAGTFREFLWCGDLPPVDLLIRTGSEQRISNFYLWDAAYAELHFCPKYWPDFSSDDFTAAISWYGERERRFGKTGEQLHE